MCLSWVPYPTYSVRSYSAMPGCFRRPACGVACLDALFDFCRAYGWLLNSGVWKVFCAFVAPGRDESTWLQGSHSILLISSMHGVHAAATNQPIARLTWRNATMHQRSGSWRALCGGAFPDVWLHLTQRPLNCHCLWHTAPVRCHSHLRYKVLLATGHLHPLDCADIDWRQTRLL
jgi:hypothetical protein